MPGVPASHRRPHEPGVVHLLLSGGAAAPPRIPRFPDRGRVHQLGTPTLITRVVVLGFAPGLGSPVPRLAHPASMNATAGNRQSVTSRISSTQAAHSAVPGPRPPSSLTPVNWLSRSFPGRAATIRQRTHDARSIRRGAAQLPGDSGCDRTSLQPLSPAYGLNPDPDSPDQLTTAIDLDDTSVSIETALSVAGFFRLSTKTARSIISSTERATRNWQREAA